MAPIPALVAAVLLAATTPVVAQAIASAPTPPATSRAGDAERVEIATEDKKVLVGTYWAPKDQKGAAPAAVLVHDAGGRREDLVEVAERLHKQGFGVLAIDLRHHGESAGKDKPWAELGEDERAKAWTFALRDVKACASWIGRQAAVHSSNVSLLGDRAGCTLVTRHAARDENVRSLTLLDPPAQQFGFDLERDIGTLAGLPTYIAVTKESQPKAESIAHSGERANEGAKFIEIAVFKGVSIAPVIDKSMVAGIAKFMASKAAPKKAEK
jgi:pimeloyl-ACP methyl ester carboxylesterase